jgi:hypothetical protein
MYIVDSFTGAKAKEVATAPRPFGAGFHSQDVENIHSLQVIGTSMNDQGTDYCDFIAKDDEGNVIAVQRVQGY